MFLRFEDGYSAFLHNCPGRCIEKRVCCSNLAEYHANRMGQYIRWKQTLRDLVGFLRAFLRALVFL